MKKAVQDDGVALIPRVERRVVTAAEQAVGGFKIELEAETETEQAVSRGDAVARQNLVKINFTDTAAPRKNGSVLSAPGQTYSHAKALAAALRPRVWVAPVWDNLHCTDDSMEAILDPSVPGDAEPLLLTTVLPVRPDGERPWWRLVPDACRTGCHVVLTVPPGGETYTLTLLDARDEEMRVMETFAFRTEP